ncbi:MAG: cytochrome c biogenesis protein ResB [Vampirovibrionales bacterium]|nr:cytochrome c biogenesis protein ResB [Vampirovibrionales bacterium]
MGSKSFHKPEAAAVIFASGRLFPDFVLTANRLFILMIEMTAKASPIQEPVGKVSFSEGFMASLGEMIETVLSCFRSVQLAIILLSLLTIATLFGVLMPQEGLVELADIKRQFGANYRIFNAMGLFSVYSSSWFLTLQALFFFNLLIGSFKWLKPAWLAGTRKIYLASAHIQASPNAFEAILGASTSSEASSAETNQVQTVLKTWLKRHRYRLFQNPANTSQWYATKGSWSRLGPHIAHIGILLMIIASVYGTFTGFKAQELAKPGDVFSLSNQGASHDLDFFKPNINETYWLGQTPDWKVKVNDFRVQYYPQKPDTVQQYYADLSVLSSDGRELKREKISVNHPLQLGDLTIYQAAYDPTGNMLVKINGQARKLKVDTQFEDRKVAMLDVGPDATGNDRMLIVFPFIVQQDAGTDANKIVVFMKTKNGFLGADADSKIAKMPDNLRLREGQSGRLGGVEVTFLRPEFATGLQIKKAPEVPLMYLSYLIIAVGALMCVFSQRMIWFSFDHNQQAQARLSVAYKTNKGRLSFLKELGTLQQVIQKA